MTTLHSGSPKVDRFASVLDNVRRVAAERDDAATMRGPHVGFCFAPPSEASPAAAAGSADRWSQAFDFIAPDEPPRREPQFARFDKAEITAEALGITSDLSVIELRRLRRQFALDNHPDRLDPAERDAATQRMTLANMLIDAALARKAAR